MALSPSALLPLARIMGLCHSAAIALPVVMEVASRKSSMTQDRIMHEALNNAPLRDYLASACRKAMAEVAA
jgi:tRNA A-37 threonylcarbamoyl transferase component Bud32